MQEVIVNFGLPEQVAAKLVTGEYNRVGGVIQDAQGRVACWLRETSPFPLSPDQMSPCLPNNAHQILNMAGSVGSVLNLGATVAFGAATLSKLGEMDGKLNVIVAKLGELERKVDRVQWSVDIGFANTLQSLELLKEYQEIEIAGALNSAAGLAWSCQFLEPGSTQRTMRIEQAFASATQATEKLLLLADREMAKAIDWMRERRKEAASYKHEPIPAITLLKQKRERERLQREMGGSYQDDHLLAEEKKSRGIGDFRMEDFVIGALQRLRQANAACALSAAISAESGDLDTASFTLEKEHGRLFGLLERIGRSFLASKGASVYDALLDGSMKDSMPAGRIDLWARRFDPECGGGADHGKASRGGQVTQ